MHPLWYLAYFFAGAFYTNAIPHLVSGLMGRAFQSPFARPPGEGLSSARVNVLWGFANLVIGYVLSFWVGTFDPRSPHMLALSLGGLSIAWYTAGHFGRFRRNAFKRRPQSDLGSKNDTPRRFSRFQIGMSLSGLRQGINGRLLHGENAVSHQIKNLLKDGAEVRQRGNVIEQSRLDKVNLSFLQRVPLNHRHTRRPAIQDNASTCFYQRSGFVKGGFAQTVIDDIDALSLGQSRDHVSKIFSLQINHLLKAML